MKVFILIIRIILALFLVGMIIVVFWPNTSPAKVEGFTRKFECVINPVGGFVEVLENGFHEYSVDIHKNGFSTRNLSLANDMFTNVKTIRRSDNSNSYQIFVGENFELELVKDLGAFGMFTKYFIYDSEKKQIGVVELNRAKTEALIFDWRGEIIGRYYKSRMRNITYELEISQDADILNEILILILLTVDKEIST